VTLNTSVLAVLTPGFPARTHAKNVKEVESRGEPVIGCHIDPNATKFLHTSFPVPNLGELSSLVANVWFQLFAHYVARLRGRSIDKPRNLAKSVIVE